MPDLPPDGGYFLPKEPPVFSREELEALLRVNFHECTARVLNTLFDTRLTGADIELCVGKRPVRLRDLGQRMVILECWHTPEGEEAGLAGVLARLIRGGGPENRPGDWPSVAIRGALLFACLGELRRAGMVHPGQYLDFAAVAGDMSAVMSGWYARAWGLPIKNLVCVCNENNGMWELLHHGELKTDTVSVPTVTPAADIPVPAGLERLIFSCGGINETSRFVNDFRCGRTYVPEEETLERMRKGLSVSVIGIQRVIRTKAAVKRSVGYSLSSYDALCYAGVQDFRAQGGGINPCVLLSQFSPEE